MKIEFYKFNLIKINNNIRDEGVQLQSSFHFINFQRQCCWCAIQGPYTRTRAN